MTTSDDLSSLIPKKWKPWVGMLGALLALIVPYVLSTYSFSPPVYLGIGCVLVVLTGFGIYHAPYLPKGTVIAPAPALPKPSVAAPVSPPDPPSGSYVNKWKIRR